MNRTIAPEFKQAQNLELILPVELKLENGISVFWLRDVKDESVRLDIEWFAGSKYQDKKLVAGFTNKLLLSGTASKNAREISEEIDFYGGFVQDECDKDHAAITLYGLRENFKSIFRVFSDSMLNCMFPDREFEEERTIALSKFKIDSDKVKYVCQRTFNACLFGENHPYGKMADETDFVNLTKADLQRFYKDYYLGTKPVLFLLGNVDDSFIEDLRQWSKSIAGKENQLKPFAVKPVLGRTEILKADAIQSAIRIGCISIDKKHPDYFGLQVLDTILGGYFGSRLMANIREDKGYTYGIGSAVAVMEESSYFFISTEVGKEVKDDTIVQIYAEFDRLKNELIPEDELERVKNYMLGEFLRQSDGPGAMMESFKNIWFNKLPLSYYSDFIHAIHKLSAGDLKQLAQRYFVKSEMVEVVVG
jgi:zinc protease